MIEFLKNNLAWVALAALSGGMLLADLMRGGAHSLSPAAATLLANREDALWLDVRDSSEWATGHIAQARHIALAALGQHLSEIERHKDKPVIVYCQRGQRGESACTQLRRAGFQRVYSLAGGVQAWIAAGLPVTIKR